ncbi:MAG: hypothetical protein HDT05_04690 [Bacteroidales bacterium]|nr:hypothetical protein [Bacteroidales bacterium]
MDALIIIFALVVVAMAAMRIYSTTLHYKKRIRASRIARARVRRIGYEKFAVPYRPEKETPRSKIRRHRRRRTYIGEPYRKIGRGGLSKEAWKWRNGIY